MALAVGCAGADSVGGVGAVVVSGWAVGDGTEAGAGALHAAQASTTSQLAPQPRRLRKVVGLIVCITGLAAVVGVPITTMADIFTCGSRPAAYCADLWLYILV